MKTLCIGLSAPWMRDFLAQQQIKTAIGAEWEVLNSKYTWANELMSGAMDAALCPLAVLPLGLPEGLAITALSARTRPVSALVASPSAFSEKAIFKLDKQAAVMASSDIQKAQLLENRPDLQVFLRENADLDVQLDQLEQGECQAIVLSIFEWERAQNRLAHLPKILLDPLEFVPAPGDGVLAFVTNRDDLAVRRLLKPLHQSAVAACTNVERGFLQQFENESLGRVAAFCERNAAGYLNAVGAVVQPGEIQRARLSSSTTFGLADALAKMLR